MRHHQKMVPAEKEASGKGLTTGPTGSVGPVVNLFPEASFSAGTISQRVLTVSAGVLLKTSLTKRWHRSPQ